MSLLEKIKGLFTKSPLPEETRLLLSGVADVDELRNGLDEIATRNEVEARGIEREIEKLASMEEAHKSKVADGSLTNREKLSTLREIKRLRRRMNSLEKRHRIHQDNIDLHLGIFDRITEMEAIEMKKISQAQIEELSVDYDEKLDQHRDIMNAARAADGLEPNYEDHREKAELAALEAEILKEAGLDEQEDPLVEAVREAVREPAPAVEQATVEGPKEEAVSARPSLDQQLASLEAGATEDTDERAVELE